MDGLQELLRLRRCVAFVARADRVRNAVVDVRIEDLEREAVERGADGGDLREDVDAVAVVLDHPLDAAHLALDSVQALDQGVLVLRVAVDVARVGRAHASTPSRSLVKRRRRRLLPTTNRLEHAIAAAAT